MHGCIQPGKFYRIKSTAYPEARLTLKDNRLFCFTTKTTYQDALWQFERVSNTLMTYYIVNKKHSDSKLNVYNRKLGTQDGDKNKGQRFNVTLVYNSQALRVRITHAETGQKIGMWGRGQDECGVDPNQEENFDQIWDLVPEDTADVKTVEGR